MKQDLGRPVTGAILFGLLGIALAIPSITTHSPIFRLAAYSCGGLSAFLLLIECFIWCSLHLNWKQTSILIAVAILLPAGLIWGLKRADRTAEAPAENASPTRIELTISPRPPDPGGFIETSLSETRPGYTSETLMRISSDGARPNDLVASGIIVEDRNDDGASAALSSDQARNLLFTVTDKNGKADSLSVPMGPGGVPYDQNVSLATEAGNTGKGGFMRMLVNGTEVGFRVLPDPIAFGNGELHPATRSRKNGLIGIMIAAGLRFVAPWALSSSKLNELIINTRAAHPGFFTGDDGILYPPLTSESDGSSPLAGTFMRNTYPP